MQPRSNPFLRPAVLVGISLAFAAIPAHAATNLFWDGADTGADAQGGNGTWDNGTTSNWDTAATGGSDSVWTNNDTAIFGGTAGTVTLGSDITVGSMTMNTTGYEFTSTGLQTLTFQSALSGTMAQLFTGGLALKWVSNQNNSSILTNTANTFSGGITIGSAVNNDRFLLSGNTIGSGTPGSLTNGVWGTGALTLGVTTSDRAQILFNSASTVNNAIVVNSAVGNSDAAGAFRVDSSNNVINGAINANLAAANFRNGGGGTGGINVTGAISGNSGLTLLAGNGTGTLNVTLTNTGTANSYAGDTTISSITETLTLGAANQIPNGTGKGNLIVTGGKFNMGGFSETINGLSGTGTVDGISGTPTLTVGDNDATSAFSGVIQNTAGTLALTKTGSGTLTLSGNNTYGGATTVSVGTLKAGSITGLSPNSAVGVAASATLDLGGFNNTIKSLSTATGTITNSTGNATLTISTTMPAATAQLFTGSLALKFISNQINSSILTNTANTFSGGITIGSTGTNDRFLLSGNTIGSGTPGALTNGVWGTGALTLGVTAADRAQILFNSASTVNNAIVVNSAVGNTDAAGAFRVDSAGNVINGAINANLAAANFRNGGSGAGAINVTGAISGISGLTLLAGNGTGTLNVTLSNVGTANSYAGNTTISSIKETLTLGAANQIPNGTGKGNLIVTAGTFKMGGFSETINGLSGTGIVDGISGTPTLTVGDNNATDAANTFSGVIKNTAGTLALTKMGSGTLTLSGANTYTGQTTLSGGKLVLSNNSAAGNSAGLVAVSGANTILEISAGNTIANNITVSDATASVNRGIAASGGAYTTGTNGNLKSNFTGSSYADTTAKILAGTNSGDATTLDMKFSGTSGATNDSARRSDVFLLSGVSLNTGTVDATDTDTYVLQLTTDVAGGLAADSRLAWLNGGSWVDAGSNFFTAAYTAAIRNVGDFGYDSSNQSVWAVVDHTGSFSAIPEPTSALAGLLIGAGLLRRRRTA